MAEFWEQAFLDKQAMWGFSPAQSAIRTAELFQANGLKNILIPGFGYGRNAPPFIERAMNVSGIEISKTAIDLAHQHFANSMQIHHGSVTDMPFDEAEYDGCFCFGLLHLLAQDARQKLIADCFKQLRVGGDMVFVTISKNDAGFGKGTKLGPNHFEPFKGVQLFFYDAQTVQQDFGKFGLIDMSEVEEPYEDNPNHPPKLFTMITCHKS